MERFSRFEDLQAALQRVKSRPGPFLTSFYAGPEQARRWIEGPGLYHLQSEGALLLLRPDGDFFHLYHAAAGAGALAGALRPGAGWPEHADLAADLIGRHDDVRVLAALYRDCGFRDHVELVRMRCTIDAAHAEDGGGAGAEAAAESDAGQVLAFLAQYLDPLAEQVPAPDEVRAMARRGEALLVRDGGALAGVLLWETTGLSVVLRYWFVSHQSRGRGVGARLIRTFFQRVSHCRRVVLWVIAGNDDAIAKYRHYGFDIEPMADQVMVRRKGSHR